jgi:hypothetical protein
MKLKGLAFDGSSTLCSALTQIQSIAGKATWLLEYTPIDFEERFVVQIYRRRHTMVCAVPFLNHYLHTLQFLNFVTLSDEY